MQPIGNGSSRLIPMSPLYYPPDLQQNCLQPIFLVGKDPGDKIVICYQFHSNLQRTQIQISMTFATLQLETQRPFRGISGHFRAFLVFGFYKIIGLFMWYGLLLCILQFPKFCRLWTNQSFKRQILHFTYISSWNQMLFILVFFIERLYYVLRCIQKLSEKS